MFKRNISILPLVLAIIVCLYYAFAYKAMMDAGPGTSPMNWSINMPSDDTSFGGAFADPVFNDSLPYYQYRKEVDSFKKIQQQRDVENKGFPLSSFSNGLWGVAKMRNNRKFMSLEELQSDSMIKRLNDETQRIGLLFPKTKNPDSIAVYKKMIGDLTFEVNKRMNELNRQRMDSEEENGLNYFTLDGYELDYDTKFFVQNGTYNLAWVKWDSTIKRTADSTRVGHYERKQV